MLNPLKPKRILSLPALWIACAAFNAGGLRAQDADDPRQAEPRPPVVEESVDPSELPRGALLRVGGLEDEALYGGMYRLLFTPDNKTFVTRDYSQTIRVWDVATGKLKRQLQGHENYVKSLEVSPDGNFLISATADPREDVRVWDINTGDCVRRVPGGGRLVQFLPDLTTVVIVSDTKIANYDMATGGPLGEFPEVRIPLAISPDGKQLAAIRRQDAEKIVLFATETGKEIAELPGLTSDPAVSRFSPDGKLLAIAGRREEFVKVWDIAQRKVVMTLNNAEATEEQQRYDVADIAFTRDNRFVATGCWDAGVRVFELASGEQIAKLAGHEDKVVAVEFSQDGRLLASGSAGRRDASAVIWKTDDCIAASEYAADEIDETILESAWTQLSLEDPAEAYGAVGTLLADPHKGLAFVKEKFGDTLKTAPVDKIEKLIEQLDSDDFGERETATEELIRLRLVAETLLRKKLEEDLKPEVKFRINKILETETPPSKLTAEQWRQMRRLIYALELLASPDAETAESAQEFLALMSTGHEDVKVMREAADAAQRSRGN